MKSITNLLATRSSCLDGALSSVGKNVTPVRAICKKKRKKNPLSNRVSKFFNSSPSHEGAYKASAYLQFLWW